MPVSSPFNKATGGTETVDYKIADLSSQVDGSTNSFTVSPSYKQDTLQVYHNGLLQLPADITQTSSTIFQTSFTPNSDDNIMIIFIEN